MLQPCEFPPVQKSGPQLWREESQRTPSLQYVSNIGAPHSSTYNQGIYWVSAVYKTLKDKEAGRRACGKLGRQQDNSNIDTFKNCSLSICYVLGS